MNIELRDRTRESVVESFEKYRQPEIQKTLPMRDRTLEEKLSDFEKSKNSFGKTIWVDDKYIGDVWLYGIDESETPEAMLSFCIFEKDFRGKGIMTEAVSLFLEKCPLSCVGAFAYADNAASLKVLQKNGFEVRETFAEDGKASVYLQRNI